MRGVVKFHPVNVAAIRPKLTSVHNSIVHFVRNDPFSQIRSHIILILCFAKNDFSGARTWTRVTREQYRTCSIIRPPLFAS